MAKNRHEKLGEYIIDKCYSSQRCFNCGKILKKGKVDYCSSNCKRVLEAKQETVVCPMCMTTFTCNPSNPTDLCECPSCKKQRRG